MYNAALTMHKLLVALVLVVVVLPAGAGPQQHSSVEESLNGFVSGGEYSNEYFDFRVKLPAGWEFAPAQTKEAVLSSLNASAPNADNRILLMLFRPIEAAPMPDIIAIFSARYRNGSGVDEALAYIKRNRKTATETELIAPIRTVRLGGLMFAREDTRLKTQAHFMAAFGLVTRGHLLSFQVHAASKERLEAVVKVLTASVRFSSQQQ